MFNFLGLRKDPKKSSSEKEKETDGGFVVIGEKLILFNTFDDFFFILKPFQHIENAQISFDPVSVPRLHIYVSFYEEMRKATNCSFLLHNSSRKSCPCSSTPSATKSETPQDPDGYLEEYLVGNKLFLIVWWAESICGWCFRPSGHINCTIFIQICKWVLIIMFPSLKKECYWFLCVWLTLSVSGQCHPCVFSGFRDSFEPEMDGRHLHILQGLCLPVSFVSPFALIF